MCQGGGGRRRRAGEGARDTESKTRTPHKDVGNKNMFETTSQLWELLVPPWSVWNHLCLNICLKTLQKKNCKSIYST